MATYSVQPNDTLSGIAARFGVGLGDLLAANPQIANPDLIAVGQAVTIPNGDGSAPAPPPVPSGDVRARVLAEAARHQGIPYRINPPPDGVNNLGGVALMVGATQAILAMAPASLPRLNEVTASAPVLLFSLGLTLVTGLLVGLLPALSAARSPAQESLRESQRTTASVTRQRVRAGFVVAEVALAMTLTIGAGLLFRSFVSVLGVDAGFQSARLLTLQISVPPRLTSHASRMTFYDDLEARVLALPGVTRVGGTTRLPLGSTNVSTT